ncbi:MAG: glycosyltransferase [Ginsengibacter sp.]
MLPRESNIEPLVSVIIPCFNHAYYLSAAVESVKKQSYNNVEIIVVDDGSSDDTAKVCSSIPGVRYYYQQNQGLSASRNNGIKLSKGAYLLFLDADDWLYPDAIRHNIHYLLSDNKIAFVSGGYVNVYENKNPSKEVTVEVLGDHYRHLLEYNYIGMVATVLYNRWVFEKYRFDSGLKACEDHDLYLKISRNHPVIHHTKIIAAYRRHDKNMSYNVPVMLSTALKVLKRQKSFLLSKEEKTEFRRSYHSLYNQLNSPKLSVSEEDIFIFKEDFINYNRYRLKKLSNKITSSPMIKSTILKATPPSVRRALQKSGVTKSYLPDVGKVSMGDFDRVTPFSKTFGFDRGGAIDRYYIENFLKKESGSVKGRALEIGDNAYTMLYGGSKISKSDILHVDESNKSATFIGDISDAPQIPDNTFDCMILTQTLHLIYDFKAALRTCHRILKPGGVLLLTVPGITPIDHDEWNSTWYWSFTDKVMRLLMHETFPAADVSVQTFGNVYAAGTFLYGMGLEEVSTEKLDHVDSHYPVIITVKAQKK